MVTETMFKKYFWFGQYQAARDETKEFVYPAKVDCKQKIQE